MLFVEIFTLSRPTYPYHKITEYRQNSTEKKLIAIYSRPTAVLSHAASLIFCLKNHLSTDFHPYFANFANFADFAKYE